jgi:uncharacterized protein (DUF1778 family)
MTTDPDPPTGRRRTYVFPGRQKRLSIRVTDDEYAELAAAAQLAGLTPTGFCAQAALDAARDLYTNTGAHLEREALSNVQAELFQARVTLNQVRAELARLGTGSPTLTDQDEIAASAAESLARLDTLISHIHTRLSDQPRR